MIKYLLIICDIKKLDITEDKNKKYEFETITLLFSCCRRKANYCSRQTFIHCPATTKLSAETIRKIIGREIIY